MNNAFIYCLAVAAQRFEVTVMAFIQMSNHLHDAIFDRHGNAPEFYGYFHWLLATCVNSLRGRKESVFNSSEQTSVVDLVTVDALVEKLVYIASNPVNADLVARVDDWPGASGFRALLDGRTLRARRPRCFASGGTMPEEVTLKLEIPPQFGDPDAIISAVEAGVARIESEAAARRARAGTRVLGRYAVLRQAWRNSPSSHEPRRTFSPRVATRNAQARVDALEQRREFHARYDFARAAFLAGAPIPFPPGTYWLPRFAGAPVQRVNFSN